MATVSVSVFARAASAGPPVRNTPPQPESQRGGRAGDRGTEPRGVCLCLFADFTRGRARSVRSFGKPGGKTDDHRPVKDQDHGAFAQSGVHQNPAKRIQMAHEENDHRPVKDQRDHGAFVPEARTATMRTDRQHTVIVSHTPPSSNWASASEPNKGTLGSRGKACVTSHARRSGLRPALGNLCGEEARQPLHQVRCFNSPSEDVAP
jgi:hypothetical protein